MRSGREPGFSGWCEAASTRHGGGSLHADPGPRVRRCRRWATSRREAVAPTLSRQPHPFSHVPRRSLSLLSGDSTRERSRGLQATRSTTPTRRSPQPRPSGHPTQRAHPTHAPGHYEPDGKTPAHPPHPPPPDATGCDEDQFRQNATWRASSKPKETKHTLKAYPLAHRETTRKPSITSGTKMANGRCWAGTHRGSSPTHVSMGG